MKLTHQLRAASVEKEVNPTAHLGFCLSNKAGSMLLFDACNDTMQYYAHVKGRHLKVLHGLKTDSRPSHIRHRLHSLSIKRGDNEHSFMVPFYMNGLLIKSSEEMPVGIILGTHELRKKCSKDHGISEKDGRIVVSTKVESSTIYTVIQGEKLTYDHDFRGGKEKFSLQMLSPKIALAVSDDEAEAIANANHIFANSDRIEEIQDDYISTAKGLADPEAAVAYACILNGTESMFLSNPDGGSPANPTPSFSNITEPHTAIASHVHILEGEFKTAKRTLVNSLERQHKALQDKGAGFGEAAWPLLMFGRLLNALCSQKKLYTYFTEHELMSSAESVLKLSGYLKSRYCSPGHGPAARLADSLESHALMLSVYNLEYALTRSQESKKAELELRRQTRVLLERTLSDMQQAATLSRAGITSVFLTAYIYPLLLSESEWKTRLDTLLDRIHHNFKILRSKMQSHGNTPLNLELFGLESLAATVLHRIDPEHYESIINQILRAAVSDVLYSGVIGRPTSSFDHELDPDSKALFENTHLLNNALFLEMLRECA